MPFHNFAKVIISCMIVLLPYVTRNLVCTMFLKIITQFALAMLCLGAVHILEFLLLDQRHKARLLFYNFLVVQTCFFFFLKRPYLHHYPVAKWFHLNCGAGELLLRLNPDLGCVWYISASYFSALSF